MGTRSIISLTGNGDIDMAVGAVDGADFAAPETRAAGEASHRDSEAVTRSVAETKG